MRADVDLLAKDDAGVKIVEKDGGPGVSLDQAFPDGGEVFAPAEVMLDLGDQGIERFARGGAPVKPFNVEQLGSHRTMRATSANRFELDNIRHSEPLSQAKASRRHPGFALAGLEAAQQNSLAAGASARGGDM
jgi:hypothetical protein